MIVAVALMAIVMVMIVTAVVIMVMVMAAAAFAVMVIMMIAVGGAVLRENAGQQLGHGFIGRAGDSGIELDIRVVQRDLRAHADAAADEGIHALRFKEACQRTVAAAHRGHDDARQLAVDDFVDLKLLSMAEVLKDLTVFISDSDFHMHHTPEK